VVVSVPSGAAPSSPADAAPSSGASALPAEAPLVILVAAVLSTAIRAEVELRALVAQASGRSRQNDTDMVSPMVDAAVDLTLRATAVVSGVAGVLTGLGRPVATATLQPPFLPSILRPQPYVARAAERGRAARANADRMSAQVAGDLVVAVLDAVLARIDLAGIVNQVIDEVDLAEIIRESSGAMASEAVVGIRIRGIEADERVNRVMDRVLLRRRDPTAVAPAKADGGD
jgi:hypothetical protein